MPKQLSYRSPFFWPFSGVISPFLKGSGGEYYVEGYIDPDYIE